MDDRFEKHHRTFIQGGAIKTVQSSFIAKLLTTPVFHLSGSLKFQLAQTSPSEGTGLYTVGRIHKKI